MKRLQLHWPRSQLRLSKHHRLERLFPMFEEEDPQSIIRHQNPPRAAHQARPGRLLRPEKLQYQHDHIGRKPIEIAQRQRLLIIVCGNRPPA